MIHINNILKNYVDFSIKVDDFKFENNSLICITGSNGSGKTTLLKILTSLTSFKGSVYIDNININKSDNWKELIATHIDDNYLLDFLNKNEFIDFFCNSYGIDFKVELRNNFFLKSLYESIPSNKLIREYSKGNKAKIGILSVLLSGVKHMIFDEPFANLDIETQKKLASYLNELKNHKTIILTTHHKEVISNCCDTFIHITNGQIK